MCVASTSFGENLRSSLKGNTVGYHEKWQERDTYPAWLGALNATCSTGSVAGAGTVSEMVAGATCGAES